MSERQPGNLENKIRAIVDNFTNKQISKGFQEGDHLIDQIPEDQEITLWDRDWLDQISRTNEYYNQSVSLEEDPRLSD